jgi:predicted outer membrane protein
MRALVPLLLLLLAGCEKAAEAPAANEQAVIDEAVKDVEAAEAEAAGAAKLAVERGRRRSRRVRLGLLKKDRKRARRSRAVGQDKRRGVSPAFCLPAGFR